MRNDQRVELSIHETFSLHGEHAFCEALRILEMLCGIRQKPHLTAKLFLGSATVQGEHMTFTMSPFKADGSPSSVPLTVAAVKADGTASKATISALTFTSGDGTVFTVAADPATPNGAIVTSVAAGTAVLTFSATATEPDGVTTNSVTGSATVILAVPPPAPAAALVATFGTPNV